MRAAALSDCPVCASPAFAPLHEAEDKWMRVPGHFQYARCLGCDQVYLRRRPAPEDMGRYYPPGYIRVGRAPARVRRFFRRRDLAGRVALVAAQPGSRVLDVGCATGEFLDAVRDTGRTVAGVEPTDWAAEAAAARGIPVWHATLAEAELPEGAFDVATLWDVVEHLDAPADDLARVRQALRPGGRLVVATPVLDGWEARRFGEHWPGWDTPRHLTVFSHATLDALLARAGFRVVERVWIYESYLVTALALTLLSGDRLPRRVAGAVGWLLHIRPVRLAAAPLFRWLDRRFESCAVTVVAERVG